MRHEQLDLPKKPSHSKPPAHISVAEAQIKMLEDMGVQNEPCIMTFSLILNQGVFSLAKS
ncbi:hypothetical protein [Brasilonema sp. UFV-L1]|uniref:hypothetical protein n=1 Tax=Brasilonema sp. UFV-L1 TaxID=2234130 RepID=UPI0030DDA93A